MFGKSQSLKQLCMTSSITEESGLIGRLIKAIFERKGLNSRLNFSMFQIYNENVYDSLQKDDVPLQVLEDVGGLSCVQGLSSFEISSEEDAFFLLAKGDKNRFVRETEYNAWSSRSHTMVMLEYSEMLEKGESKTSRTILCDLAGSERMKELINPKDKRFAEMKYINLSLTALGKLFLT